MINRIINGALIILFAAALDCRAEGLDTLIEMGRSQAQIQEQYAEETRAFEKVKKAIGSGDIRKDETKSAIRATYGAPVVVVKDPDGKREDWMYKPSSSSFFKGIRAVLVFSQAGLLEESRLEER